MFVETHPERWRADKQTSHDIQALAALQVGLVPRDRASQRLMRIDHQHCRAIEAARGCYRRGV